MIGLTVLERTGVSAYRGERMQLPATASSETGYERQARLIGAVLLEANQQMGVDLGPEIEEALAKDARECAELQKTPRENLPRLSDFSGNASERKVTSRN